MLGIKSVLNRSANEVNTLHGNNIYTANSISQMGSLAFQSVKNVINEKSPIQWLQYTSVGVTTGAIGALVLAPMDLIKLRLQVQGAIGSSNRFTGPLHAARHIFEQGGIRGLYRGLPGVALREFFYYIAYLPTYEMMRSLMRVLTPDSTALSTLFNNPDGVLHFIRCGVSGGIAGMAAWTFATPAECVKNRYLAHGNKRYKSLVDCAVHTFREGGLRMLFAGLKPAVLRAFPVHCTFWLTYEVAKEYLLLFT